ncbi:hypothetical protein HUJ05_002307 [Dendroctonus ponderosae]|nr:hypothetical protein HUJ05_002307 [Dendroctonus ponderosae]
MERVAVKELCKYGWDHGRSLMMFRNVAELDFLGTRAKIDLFREQTSRIIDTVNKQEVSRKTQERKRAFGGYPALAFALGLLAHEPVSPPNSVKDLLGLLDRHGRSFIRKWLDGFKSVISGGQFYIPDTLYMDSMTNLVSAVQEISGYGKLPECNQRTSSSLRIEMDSTRVAPVENDKTNRNTSNTEGHKDRSFVPFSIPTALMRKSQRSKQFIRVPLIGLQKSLQIAAPMEEMPGFMNVDLIVLVREEWTQKVRPGFVRSLLDLPLRTDLEIAVFTIEFDINDRDQRDK